MGLIPWQITNNPIWVVFSTALFKPATEVTTVISASGFPERVATYAVLSESGMPYPLPTILFYGISLFFAYVIVFNKNTYGTYKQKIQKIIDKNKKLDKYKKAK